MRQRGMAHHDAPNVALGRSEGIEATAGSHVAVEFGHSSAHKVIEELNGRNRA